MNLLNFYDIGCEYGSVAYKLANIRSFLENLSDQSYKVIRKFL